MDKLAKSYLMISGTLLPAIAGVTMVNIIRKKQGIDNTSLLVFAGLSILGGYLTAKMLHK